MSASPCPACGATSPAGDALSSLCATCLLQAASPVETSEFEPGSALGPYEIVSRLGSGGMGQVYLAWDSRLCRTVAIKVLPAPFAADTERTRRLEREARIVAGLNHPRICAVYDLGHEHGLTYIVMEHLDGETLAERLTRGPLPLDEALTLGIEIADGLDRAHRHDVTHRDLKPANIMLTRSGAKLLDFGLAVRSCAGVAAGTPAASADSISAVGGTVQYMAPEQLEGKSADVRSDVFAFGLVLHEMLMGQDSTRPRDVPPALERIVHRCLRKDPEDRWQSLRDVLFELTAVVEEPARVARTAQGSAPAAAWRKRWTMASAAAATLAVVTAGALVVPTGADPQTTAIRFVASMPGGSDNPSSIGATGFVSPDGRSLAWLSANRGLTVLSVQRFDSSEATLLPGTEGARWPFWSPDSRTIAFFAKGELRKIPASGGPVERIATATNGGGGTWGSRGTIVFAPDRLGPLYEVSDRGGDPKPATTLDAAREEISHQWPVFLPDGRHVVYFASSARPEHRGLYVAQSGMPAARWLGTSDGGSVWAPPRSLLFRRAGMLVSQAFDLTQLRIVGEPHVVHPRVCGTVGTIVPPCFSASTTGVLVYHVARLFRHQLAWFTRSGRQLDVAMEVGSYFSPVLSPDGRRVALERHDPETWQLGIWQFDLGRRVLSRIPEAPLPAMGALWSRDGQALAFANNTEVRHDIFTVNAQGGSPELLFSGQKHVLLTDWASDDRRMLLQAPGDGTGSDVWVLTTGDRKASLYLGSRFNERQARFSPDGRWVAYSSDESGRTEVYVQAFPSTGAKWQVSNDAGHEPTWRGDGRELYYLSGDRRVMAVPVRLNGAFSVGSAVELFRVPADAPMDSRISYAPAADGQRFLVNVTAPDRVRLPPLETEVIVNWQATLHD